MTCLILPPALRPLMSSLAGQVRYRAAILQLPTLHTMARATLPLPPSPLPCLALPRNHLRRDLLRMHVCVRA
jgi:hypothetical protein